MLLCIVIVDLTKVDGMRETEMHKEVARLLEVVFRFLGYYGIGTTHTSSSSQR